MAVAHSTYSALVVFLFLPRAEFNGIKCRDSKDECHQLILPCKFDDVMREYCPVKCEMCVPTTTPSNNGGCYDWWPYCYRHSPPCTDINTNVTKWCPRTCKVCEGSSRTLTGDGGDCRDKVDCKIYNLRNGCPSNNTWFREMCPAYCNACTDQGLSKKTHTTLEENVSRTEDSVNEQTTGDISSDSSSLSPYSRNLIISAAVSLLVIIIALIIVFVVKKRKKANLRPERPLQTISQQRPVRKSEIRHSALSDREAHIYNYISGEFKLPSNFPECVQSSFKRMKYIADQCQVCPDCGYSYDMKKSCLECEINYKMPDMGYSTPDVDYIKPDFAFPKNAEYQNLDLQRIKNCNEYYENFRAPDRDQSFGNVCHVHVSQSGEGTYLHPAI